MLVSLSPAVGVGAVGLPVNAGDANDALPSSAVCNPDVSAIDNEPSTMLTVPENETFTAARFPVNDGDADGCTPNRVCIAPAVVSVFSNLANGDMFVMLANVDAPPLMPPTADSSAVNRASTTGVRTGSPPGPSTRCRVSHATGPAPTTMRNSVISFGFFP